MSTALPPLYDAWIKEALGFSPQSEPRSTCASCAMASDPTQPDPERPFVRDLKCCTYHPDLPNFHLGGILDENNPVAVGYVRKRIDGGVGVSPWGMTATSVYRTLYAELSKQGGSFGRLRKMRCPFYVDEGTGLCAVYHHRESVCSTYYCKFEQGARGKAMWGLLKRLLARIERAVIMHCVQTLDLGERAFRLFMVTDVTARGVNPAEVDGRSTRAAAAQAWGNYAGREAEFFVACRKIAAALTWPEVSTLLGVEGQALIRLITQTGRAMGRLPERVTAGNVVGLVQLSRRPGYLRIRNPEVPTDMPEVPAALISSIPKLISGPLAETLPALQQSGVPVDERMVRVLVDNGVLLPV